MILQIQLVCTTFPYSLFLGKNLEDTRWQRWNFREGDDLPICPCIRVFLSVGRTTDNPGSGSRGILRSRLATGVTFVED